ncbi:ABC transporter ATP-binding protein [Aquabacter spiritensis]|uniref:Amino acid/amide ABC transporter ATP-binding protein 2 (HAAT family) n=1 Tax=Aquabacter spiritensis TaxID=933073 RepID=A0A4V2UXP8_9HYPH|nr:ABC transporter ATP-binding protein [Aquabacter spiritensis]TCT04348.1 amino acid/amide ABC transporter ATP-binding protein 2 (HAAT family) [Aquabacter spiritensis]
MLSLEGVSVRYGGLSALTDVSLSVGEGEFVTVIGPNGAGKTTLMKAISGVVPLSAGRIRLGGQDLAAVPAQRRPHLGLAHVPENRQVFSGLSVLENLELGTTPLADRAQSAGNIEHVLDLFPILRERTAQLAGTLSGGQQQMLAIGRALASTPKVLLLDEPSMGLAPSIVDMIFERIARIHRETGVTVVLVEQRAIEALELCTRAYVLTTGRVVASGSGRDLMRSEEVSRAYLGA